METVMHIWFRHCPSDPEKRGVKPQKYGLKCTAYIDMRLELPPEAVR